VASWGAACCAPTRVESTILASGAPRGCRDAFFFLELGEGGGDERVAAFAPGSQAALQGANALDAVFSEEQRHTGAGGFVWSSTIEDHFAVARQAVVFLLQLLGFHVQGSGNDLRLGFEIQRMPQVHDCDWFPRIDFLF
jgi:hypothetical protein